MNVRAIRRVAFRWIQANAMSIALLALGLYVMAGARRMRAQIFRNIGNNPATFPWLLGLCISVLCGASIIIDSVRFFRNTQPASAAQVKPPVESGRPSGWKCSLLPASIPITAVVYTLLVPILGYMLASILWAVVLLLIFRSPRFWIVAGIVAAVVVVTFVVFQRYLPVRLPRGWILP